MTGNLLEQFKRVDSCVGQPRAPMEMRSRDPSGGSRQRQHVALSYQRSLADPDLGKMKIHREERTAMIHHDAAAGEEKISRQYNLAMIGRNHFRSSRRREIQAAMRRPRRAVDDPSPAEGRRRFFVRHGPKE